MAVQSILWRIWLVMVDYTQTYVQLSMYSEQVRMSGTDGRLVA